MNWFVFSAGLLFSFMTVGHFVVGSKEYLKPMLNSDMNLLPKKVMLSVFHYISVFMILSSVILLASGAGYFAFQEYNLLVKFISINLAGFAVWQIAIALSSGIQNALIKMFQWIMFLAIALLAWLGT